MVDDSAFLSSTFRDDCMKFRKSMQLKDSTLTDIGAKEKLVTTLLTDDYRSLLEKWMPDLRNWLELEESASSARAQEIFTSDDLSQAPSLSPSNWRTSEFPKLVLYTLWITRCLVLTDRRQIGQAPATTKPGDIICIILGCAVPMVLRPAEGHWEVVGRLLYGIMQGEAITAVDDGKVQAQDFKLH